MSDQTQGHRITNEERKRRMSTFSQSINTPLSTPMPMPPYMNFFHRPMSQSSLPMPQYLRPLPLRFLMDDIEYLDKKGALTVPETPLRNELLRSYAQFVHPFLPVLDLKEFLTPIEQNDVNNPISLLLFQAVMFAGTAYIDMRFLQAAGFETRKAARKAFWQRVRLLYDFDYESDRIALVQALLIMTYWYETPMTRKTLGIGWESVFPSRIRLACIETRQTRICHSLSKDCGNVSGGHALLVIDSSRWECADQLE